MSSLVIPLIVAATFTAGGYTILKLERQAEPIGDWLFAIFVLVAMATGALTASRVVATHHPRLTAELHERGRSQGPPWQGQMMAPVDRSAD